MKRAAWFVSLVIIFHGAPGWGASLDSEVLGEWVFAGSEAEQHSMLEAIEGVVKNMNFFIRGMARNRLRESNVAVARLVVALRGQKLSFSRDDFTLSCHADGRKCRGKGQRQEDISIMQSLFPEKFREYVQAQDGDRTTELVRQGDTLLMTVRITSHRLPAPLVYTLTYAKPTH